MGRLLGWVWDILVRWLLHERPPSSSPLSDFHRLAKELQVGDVILVEGRSRVSDVIKLITQSPWTHSAVYIGRAKDVEDPELQVLLKSHYEGDPKEQLLIEALLGQGTVVVPINKYGPDHLRICRPSGLCPADATKVRDFAISKLGTDYDVRQLLDLARFFFPWTILPRRWRSSLFEHNAGKPTHTVCSHIIAEAFMLVNYPILPFIDRRDDGSIRFLKRNPRLFTPRDFDYSPYFNIVKYPFLGLDDLGVYRQLPWSKSGHLYNDDEMEIMVDQNEDYILLQDEVLQPEQGCDCESKQPYPQLFLNLQHHLLRIVNRGE